MASLGIERGCFKYYSSVIRSPDTAKFYQYIIFRQKPSQPSITRFE